MSKLCSPLLKACVVPTVLLAVATGRVTADDSATTSVAKKRMAIRDQRPDDSRGWLIISKDSYWPLCYESLDRIEEARNLIGTGDQEQVADALDKCGAWLRLAASAAMTEGKSGIADTAFAFQEAANSLRDGSSDWSDKELSDLTTLGLVVMAKSHVLRADAADQAFKPARTSSKPKNPSVLVKNAEKEIARENTDRTLAQYRHDTIEAQRHLTVAQTYLEAAAQAGPFSLDDGLTAPIPEYNPLATPSQSVEYTREELRPRIRSMTGVIADQQSQLGKQLSEKL